METYGPRTRRSVAREEAEGTGMARRTRSSVARAAASPAPPHAGRSRSTRGGGARRTTGAVAARRATAQRAVAPVSSRAAVVPVAAASTAAAGSAGDDASAPSPLPSRALSERRAANVFRTPRTARRRHAASAAAASGATVVAPSALASATTPEAGFHDHTEKENGGCGVEAEGLRTPVAQRGGTCAICLSPLKKHAREGSQHRRRNQQSELYTIQGCGHTFHRACLTENRRAGNEGCPCCRGFLEQGLTPAPTVAERRAAEERAAEAQAIQNAQNAAGWMVMEVSAAMRESRDVRSAAEAALTRAAVAESAAAAAVVARAEAAGAGGAAVGIAAATARGEVAIAVAEAAAAAERAADAADSTAISAVGSLSLFGASAGATIDGLTAAIEASRAVLAAARDELEASRTVVEAVAMGGLGGDGGELRTAASCDVRGFAPALRVLFFFQRDMGVGDVVVDIRLLRWGRRWPKLLA